MTFPIVIPIVTQFIKVFIIKEHKTYDLMSAVKVYRNIKVSVPDKFLCLQVHQLSFILRIRILHLTSMKVNTLTKQSNTDILTTSVSFSLLLTISSDYEPYSEESSQCEKNNIKLMQNNVLLTLF